MTAYSTGAACPLERMKRSRSAHLGFFGSCRIPSKYSVTRRSVADSEPPGWPDPAAPIITTISRRTRLAIACNSSTDLVSGMGIPQSYHPQMRGQCQVIRGRSAPLRQAFRVCLQESGRRLGEIGENNVRPGAMDGGKGLHHGAFLIDPTVAGGRHDHGEFAAHLVSGDGHVE